MYFSVEMQGFYVGDRWDIDIMPDDCVEVSADNEEQIRQFIMEGYKITSVTFDTLQKVLNT